MKVIYIVTPQLFDGGTASVSYNYYKMFILLGYDVRFYLLDDLPISDKFNVDMSSVNYLSLLSSSRTGERFWSFRGLLGFVSNLKKSVLTLSKLKGDIVFVHFTPMLLGVIVNLFFDRSFKFIYTVHTNVFSYRKQLGFIKKTFFNFFLSLFGTADELVFLTKDVSEEYRLNYKGYRCRVSCIPNVYEVFNKSSISIDDVSRFKANYNLNDRSFILYSGRLSYEKNISFIINVYKKYKDNGGNKTLLIAGDGPEKHSLYKLVTDLDLLEYVKFLGQVDSMHIVYSISDTLFLASNHEGFGMVLLEAIDFGLNLISSNCPSGPATIFEQSFDIPLNSYYKNELGFLLPTPNNNFSDYCDALISLDNMSELDPNLISSVLSNFSIDSISIHWLKVLEK